MGVRVVVLVMVRLAFCVIMRSSKLDALFHVLLYLIHQLLGLVDGVVTLCEILS